MKNKFRYLRIFILIIAVIVAVSVNGGWRFNLNLTAFASGELTIDWGVPSGDPIFVVENMAPGECQTRSVSVLNNSAVSREVGVRGVKTEEDLDLGSILEIKIDRTSSPTATVYGPQALDQFFSASSSANAIILGTQNSSESVDYDFIVCFPETAGNEFQKARIVFDLSIGVVVPTPDECLEMEFDNTVFGTNGNDRIRGTSASELIFGLEGNDRIDGGGGDDCIVGGSGNDRINDSTGKDVVVGGTGNDEIDAGSDADLIVGNDGNDKLIGGSGNDLIFGNSGEDKIEGGSGLDEIYGGDQNDLLEGGSGSDQIFGDFGNDNLKGGSDDDTLDGGEGTNVLNGDSGQDICINGPTRIKCELP